MIWDKVKKKYYIDNDKNIKFLGFIYDNKMMRYNNVNVF